MSRMMCPKNDLLSAYFDGEIGSPWDAAIAAHLESCARCREKLSGFKAVADRLRAAEAPGLQEAVRRVRQRIDLTIEEREECLEPASAAAEGRSGTDERVPFFKRQVLLPVPVLAGGLSAMFILVASLFFFVGKSGSDLSQARAELENLKTIHVYYSAHDQNQFMGLMSSNTLGEDVVFELPGNDIFKVGRPEVIYVKERK